MWNPLPEFENCVFHLFLFVFLLNPKMIKLIDVSCSWSDLEIWSLRSWWWLLVKDTYIHVRIISGSKEPEVWDTYGVPKLSTSPTTQWPAVNTYRPLINTPPHSSFIRLSCWYSIRISQGYSSIAVAVPPGEEMHFCYHPWIFERVCRMIMLILEWCNYHLNEM